MEEEEEEEVVLPRPQRDHRVPPPAPIQSIVLQVFSGLLCGRSEVKTKSIKT